MNCLSVTSLAQAVAAELQMTAAPGPADDESDAWLTGGPERLHFHAYEDRIIVTGMFPSTQHPVSVSMPLKITVNAGRGHTVIAREISRRLLPRYRGILAEVQACNAADAAEAAARNELAAALTVLIPPGTGEYPVILRQGTGSTVLYLDTACGRGQVRISGDATTVYLELRDIPAAAALRMLTAITSGTGLQP